MEASRTVLTAQHVMQRTVYVLRPETQVLDAIDELVAQGFSGAPVVADGKLVGVFSERDALAAISSAHYDGEPPGTVAQHMRRDFDVVAATTDIYEVASVFQRQPIRRLPVVDHECRLLGIVSRGDVLSALRRLYPHLPKTNYQRLQDHMALRHGASF
ncbi:MAG: CBS domain-containing protein [Planctomycetes bacterium]|nr:CBS domain-containing protein [Planctomycetota bacterium]